MRNRRSALLGAAFGFHIFQSPFGCRLQKRSQQLNRVGGFNKQRLGHCSGNPLVLLGGCKETINNIGEWT